MRQFFGFLFIAAIAIGLFFLWDSHSKKSFLSFNQQAFKHEFVVIQAHHLLGFNLMDPEQSPPDIRESVMRGFHLMMHTSHNAPDYAQNALSCTNCHFLSGDTIGGKNGGISLVGVTKSYPQYSQRSGKVLTLAERIDNCFQRSMNGKSLPPTSPYMIDMINYLKWISKEVEPLETIPWLGLPELRSTHKPDPEVGKTLYVKNCAACHRMDGEGGGILDEIKGKTIPPLWGKDCFNDGAGMSTLKMLAPFVYLNMPYQQAHLTEEEALDISSYVLQQRRPRFSQK